MTVEYELVWKHWIYETVHFLIVNLQQFQLILQGGSNLFHCAYFIIVRLINDAGSLVRIRYIQHRCTCSEFSDILYFHFNWIFFKDCVLAFLVVDRNKNELPFALLVNILMNLSVVCLHFLYLLVVFEWMIDMSFAKFIQGFLLNQLFVQFFNIRLNQCGWGE